MILKNRSASNSRIVIAVMGPTASGKSDVAFQLAGRINGEIISADSRQVYKYMDIATAKPPIEHMKKVRHHFISILEPDEDFSAGDFARRANDIIRDCFERQIQPIVAGGSGLYLRALTDGFYSEEIKSAEIRENLNKLLAEKGKQHLYDLLVEADPESAARTSAEFSRRVFRALEVYYISGIKLSELQKENVRPQFTTLKYAIDYPRNVLYERINNRTVQMLERGLVNEVEKLMERGFHYSKHNSVNTVGIKEVMMYVEGKTAYDEMVSAVQQNSRRYAKRQMTWLRKEQSLNWIDVSGLDVSSEQDLTVRIADEIHSYIRTKVQFQ